MAIGQVLKDWWKLFATVVGVVALFVKLYPLLEGWADRWALKHYLSSSGGVGTGYRFTGSGDLAAGVLLLLLAASLLAYTFYAYAKLKKNQAAGEANITTLKAGLIACGEEIAGLKSTFTVSTKEAKSLKLTFDEALEATNLIANQLFPAQPMVMKTIVSFKRVLTIKENGDGHVRESYLIAGNNFDIHFFEKKIFGEGGEPAPFPDAIGLKIESGTTGKDLAVLPSQNDPLQKSVLIFFLPFIAKGGTDRREVAVTYHWKGLFRKLATEKKDEFEGSLSSSDPIPNVEYQFWMEPGSTLALKCINTGPRLNSEQLKEVTDTGSGMKYWKYEATNVPSGHATELKLVLV